MFNYPSFETGGKSFFTGIHISFMLFMVREPTYWTYWIGVRSTVCVVLLVFLPGVDTAVSSAGQYHQLTTVSSVGVESQIDCRFVCGLCAHYILINDRRRRLYVCDSTGR